MVAAGTARLYSPDTKVNLFIIIITSITSSCNLEPHRDWQQLYRDRFSSFVLVCILLFFVLSKLRCG